MTTIEVVAICDHHVVPREPDIWLKKWMYPEQAGNLGPGWRQYRKMLPGEAVAPLPEAYR